MPTCGIHKTACSLSHIVQTVQDGLPDDREEMTRKNWEDIIQSRIDNGDEFDSQDGDMFHILTP